MSTSKHIFLQINTENIIEIYEERENEIKKSLRKDLKKKFKKREGKESKEEFKKELKKALTEKIKKENILANNEILSNCLIYSQGAMSLGNPIKSFTIDVDLEEEIYFTIVPLFLFIRHKLYFRKFDCQPDPNIKPVPELGGKNKPVSFCMKINKDEKNKTLPFSLEIILEYQDLKDPKKTIEIPLIIDPVLQVVQPK